MSIKILQPESATQTAHEKLLELLLTYNENTVGDSNYEPLVLLIEDENKETIGGYWGQTAYDWLLTELLVIPHALRGQGYGTSLMFQAENLARERGCKNAWVTTFSFQAPLFYEKLGYKQFGVLDQYPANGAYCFLKKELLDS